MQFTVPVPVPTVADTGDELTQYHIQLAEQYLRDHNAECQKLEDGGWSRAEEWARAEAKRRPAPRT